MPDPRTLAALASSTLLALVLASCGGSGAPGVPTTGGAGACGAMDSSCAHPSDCCSGSCTAGTCDCSPLAARCGNSNDCCETLSARKCSGGACVSGCRSNGDVCTFGGDCCSLNCDTSHHCAPPCVGYGTACTSSSQCCAYLGCPAGSCTTTCKTSGLACSSSNECCSGYGCRAGSCQSGACGTIGQRCDSAADCCSYAQSGKNYVCELTGGAHGTCTLAQPFEACASDADCAGSYPCRGGYCHYADGSRSDSWSCLDGVECASGHCTATAAGVPGVCCSGAGTSCVAGGGSTLCCSPLACTGPAGSQTCSSCLGPDNSGAGHPYQCSYASQCCPGASLTCQTSTGQCCKILGASCVAGSECCTGETCGTVTDWQGVHTDVCCGAFQGWCGGSGSCCDGLLCANYNGGYGCLKAPGQPCQASSECANAGIGMEGCRIPTSPTGACCLHDSGGTCKVDSDCCSGICDPGSHFCQYAPPYGQCLTNADCQWMLNTSFAGNTCGGNATVGPLRCCPTPGQTCASAADCCETGDDCQPSLAPEYTGTTSPVCCRATQRSCAQDYECCTGVCDYQGGAGSFCCGYPWMTTFACASDADCCRSTGTIPASVCNLTTNRCCYPTGQTPGPGNAALCCSGRVDPLGSCR